MISPVLRSISLRDRFHVENYYISLFLRKISIFYNIYNRKSIKAFEILHLENHIFDAKSIFVVSVVNTSAPSSILLYHPFYYSRKISL